MGVQLYFARTWYHLVCMYHQYVCVPTPTSIPLSSLCYFELPGAYHCVFLGEVRTSSIYSGRTDSIVIMIGKQEYSSSRSRACGVYTQQQ